MKQKRQVVMLPTKERKNHPSKSYASHSGLITDFKGNFWSNLDKRGTPPHHLPEGFRHVELYIIPDEEIKEGDWYILPNMQTLHQSGVTDEFVGETEFDAAKKIIATTDKSLTTCNGVKREGESCSYNNNCKYPDCQISQIPQSLVSSYANKPFDYVMLEYVEKINQEKSYPYDEIYEKKLKLTDNNEVVWSEPKSLGRNLYDDLSDEEKKKFADKWMEEMRKAPIQIISNEKMYSREEVDIEKARYANDMNRDIQAKILSWYAEHDRDPEFAKHFGITSVRKGKID